LEAVALAGGDNAALWLDELRYVQLEISGDDLLTAGADPGPAIGDALEHALALTLNGEVAGREQQLGVALAHAREAAQ
jgi:hypothetical protein